MICKECKGKPVARGVKFATCFECENQTIVNCAYIMCDECSDKLHICQCCEREVKNV
jgi:hypothetical protein